MNTNLPLITESKIQATLNPNPMNKRTQATGFLRSCKTLFLILALMMLGSQWSLAGTFTIPGKSHANIYLNKANLAKISKRVSTEGGMRYGMVKMVNAPEAPSTPILDPDSDSGRFNSDRITKNQELIFIGTAEDDAMVTLYDTDGTTEIGTAVAIGGNWAIFTEELDPGAHTITAKANNGEDSPASGPVVVMIDITKPTAPTAPDLTEGTDSNVDNDNNTNAEILDLTGTVEPGATVKLFQDAVEIQTVNADETTGIWNASVADLNDGTYLFTITITDLAGNDDSDESSALTVKVDRTASVPGDLNMSALNDSGLHDDDNITSDDTPEFNGSGEEGDEITLFSSVSGMLGTTTVTAGVWSFEGSLGEGEHTITAESYDLAGNTSEVSDAIVVIVDKTNPSPDEPDLDPADDTGVSAIDNITTNTTPTFTGTVDAGAKVELFEGANPLNTTTADGGSGVWSITSSVLPDDVYNVSIKVTDLAGNEGVSSVVQLTIDNSAPTITSVNAPSDDTYVKDETLDFTVDWSENVTNLTGAVIAVNVGGTSRNAVFHSGDLSNSTIFRYTVQNNDEDSDGIAVATAITGATVTDEAGNNAVLTLVGVGGTADVKVDATVPTLTAVTIGSDNTSNTAYATVGNIVKVTFTSSEDIQTPTATIATKTATIDLLDGSANLWQASYEMESGDDAGIIPFSISFTDIAGNAGTAVIAVTSGSGVTFDEIAPTVTITPDKSTLKKGETATITFEFDEDPLTTFIGTDITVTGGTLGTLSGTGLERTAELTPDDDTDGGSVDISVEGSNYQDAAGNAGTTGNMITITYDTKAPDAPTSLVLDDSSDTGTSDSDNLTNDDTPLITGLAEAGAAVTLFDGITPVGTVSANGSGVWSFTLNTLAAGEHTITAVASDAAGNYSEASDALIITIDKTAPTLLIGSNKSILKKNETAAITFTFSEDPGSTFEWDDTTGDVVVTGGVLSAIGGSGLTRTATFTPTDNTNNGTVSITVAASSYTDAAGNNGGAGTTPSVSFDTNVPAAPAALDLVTASDSGFDTADDKTKDATPEIAGTSEANASITLYDGSTAVGTASANGSGVWSFSTNSLSEGSRTLTAKATDAAGNESTASSSLVIVVDTTVPTITSVDFPADDTYKIGENLDFTVHFSEAVRNPAGSNLTIALNAPGNRNATHSSGQNTSAWVYRYTVQATDMDNNGIALPSTLAGGTLADEAGNTFSTPSLGSVGSTAGILVDGVVPTLTAVTIESNNDNTTYAKVGNTVTVTFTSSETIQTPTATIATKTATITGSGTSWTASYEMETGDAAGTIPFSISFADNAGNAGTNVIAVTSGSGVTFDEIVPAAPSIPDLLTADDTGTSTSDNLTKTTTPTFTGTAESGVTVTLYANGDEIGSGVATGGNYSIVSSTTLTSAEYEITAEATDLAGNTGVASAGLDITIDASAPAITSVSVPANGTYVKDDELDFTVDWTEDVLDLTGAVIVVNVGGTSRNAIFHSGDESSVTVFRYTVQNGDNDSDGIALATAITGATITDAAGNNAVLTLNDVGATTDVKVDAAVPTLSAVTIASDNTSNTAYAKVGNLVTVTFTSSETIQIPTATIATKTATITGSGTSWIASYEMETGDAAGTIPFSVSFADLAGNAGTNVIAVTSGSGVTFDEIAPSLTAVSIISNNANTALAKPGNTITVTFTASETIQEPVVKIAGHDADDVEFVSGEWKATYELLGTEDDGIAGFSITFKDLASNAGAAPIIATTDNSEVEINNSVPQLTLVTISSDNDDITKAKTGDKVTINFTANKEITTPGVIIGSEPADDVQPGVGTNEWIATYTFTGSGEAQGLVEFTISFEDLASNAGTDVSATTNSSSVTYDKTVPTLSGVHIESDNDVDDDRVRVGDEVELVFTSSETITTPTVTIAGHSALVELDEFGGPNDWIAYYNMASGDNETSSVPFTIDFADPTGNAGTRVTATSDMSAVLFDKTSPTVVSVQGVSSDATYKLGQTVSVSVTFSENVDVDGAPKLALNTGGTANYSGGTGTSTLTFSYVVGAGDDNGNNDLDYTSTTSLSLNGGSIIDRVGNDATLTLPAPGATNSLADISDIIIDGIVPTLTAVTYSVEGSSTNIIAKTGNEIILQFSASEAIATPTVTILGHSPSTLTNPLDNHWRATYTITGGDADGPVTFDIAFSDVAGNAGAGATETTNDKVISINRSNADLSALVLSAGSFNTPFVSGTTTYNVTVANSVASITVKPTLADITATSLKVNTVDVASGVASGAINLTAGVSTPVNVVVVAQNGTSTKTYTLNVTRSLVSDNALLYGIKSPDYTLVPAFNSNTFNYTATVANTVTSAKITAVAQVAASTITVGDIAVTSGNLSPTVQLSQGLNTIRVISTAEDGVSTKAYSIAITREAPVVASDEVAPDDNGNVTPTAGKPTIVVNYNTVPLIINTGGDTRTNFIINLSALLEINNSLVTPQITTTVVPGDGQVSLEIPSTTITAIQTGWDGTLILPKSTTYDVPASPGKVVVSGIVVEVGNPNFGLSLDKAARLVFPGQAGKRAAMVHSGQYEEITKVGLTDTQAEGDALAKDQAYRIDVGSDLIVWTKAFSKFMTFNEEVDLNVAIVASDLALLTADGIKGANVDLNNITAKLDALPSSMNGGSTVTWSSSDPSLISADGQTINRPTAGPATVTLTATVKKGNITQTKTFTLTLLSGNQAPTLAAIANQALCYTTTAQTIGLTGITAGPDAGQTTTLSVSSSNPGLFSSLSVTGTGSTGTISYVPGNTAGGTATITVTVRDNGGTSNGGVDTFTRTFTITVNPAPAITITSNMGASISKGLTAVLSATGGTTYTWANASGIVSGQNSPILTVRPTVNTTYTVTVTNATGCVSTQSFNLIVNEDYQALDINNIMSPNGDGRNDKLVIKNLDMYPNNTVKIFDRAGRLLYTKVNYTNDWDGTFQGTPLTNDTYFYVVDFGAGKKQIRGFVSIVNQ